MYFDRESGEMSWTSENSPIPAMVHSGSPIGDRNRIATILRGITFPDGTIFCQQDVFPGYAGAIHFWRTEPFAAVRICTQAHPK